MQTIKQSILSIVIGLALVAGLSYAWEGATKNPPEDNAPAPINVGNVGQTKIGPLGVNGFNNTGGSVFNGNVGIGVGIKAEDLTSLFEIKSGSVYIKKGTFTCETGETAKFYKTAPKTCGTDAGKCTQVTTASHPWSETNKTQETADYKGGGDCKEDKTCLATPYVKCQTAPQPLIKVVNGVGLSITDGSQGEGKVLTSDVNGKAGWAEPSSSRPNVSLSSYTKSGYGAIDLKFHDYCAISYHYDSDSGDSQKIGFRVYPHATLKDGDGRSWWYLENFYGYNPVSSAMCFDFI